MLDEKSLRSAYETWRDGPYRRAIERQREAGLPPHDLATEPLYTPADVVDLDYERDLGFPGAYPFTRGIYPSMYRGRFWTMRQYAGYGTAEETNERFRYMLAHGLTGMNLAFDMPTQLGYDTDDANGDGEVGVVGVAIDSLRDMEILFADLPLAELSPAMAINAPAAVILAMYLAVAEQAGAPRESIAGSTQNDILKEFLARGTYIFPPGPALRLATDIVEYCSQHLPRWNFINVCGYHIREAGGTIVHEAAFGMADAITYVQAALDRGLDVDQFAPRFAFNFSCFCNVFEEAAKLRALRRMWAHTMRERFGARNPASWLFRTGAGSGGSTLVAQQAENNIVRVALHTLAGVLGGAQSMHTAAYDEALALPSEHSATLALRTQQIIAHESGAADVIDPLAGSYYVESLTTRIEDEATALVERIERLGGMVRAIESGWAQQQIADAAWCHQRQVEGGERVIVGVNRYQDESPAPAATLHRIDPRARAAQCARLAEVRQRRDQPAVRRALDDLRDAVRSSDNLMPPLIAAVKTYATLGEICGLMREEFGEYRAPQIY
ncbi:MAG: methylmalonyl-CoA mutase [Chloroflexi bacterium]|nr:methylmalonyl-CoA mutase [Chloroflexota bacterium]